MKPSMTVCAILFCLCLFGMAVAFWALPKKEFSAVEKRALQPLPKGRISDVLSGDFQRQFDAFYADQFPLRTELVGWKARAEILLGKEENNGILLGAGGRLARRRFDMRTPEGVLAGVDFPSEAQISAACAGILRANANLSVPFAALLTGRNVDVCPSAFSYPSDFSDRLNAAVRAQLDGQVAAPDLVSLFRA